MFDHLAAVRMYNFGHYDETLTANMIPGVLYPKMWLKSNDYDMTPGYPAGLGNPGGVIIGWEHELAYVKAGHKMRIGACPGTNSAVIPAGHQAVVFKCAPAPKEAAPFDAKIDDGKPYSGIVVITSNTYINRIPDSGFVDETSGCGNYTTNTYRLANPHACPIELHVDF